MWMNIHIELGTNDMKTIQMTIDETLLEQVDQTVQVLSTTRSAFIREALERALRYYHILKMEERDADGYAQIPAYPGDVEEWASEQVWGDEWKGAK
jgi:metal-responsive CopG/Arc/MetJ family transcriptional regulator